MAIEHFNNFYNNVGYPISLSRGAYWLGLAYEKINDLDNAKSAFLKTHSIDPNYKDASSRI